MFIFDNAEKYRSEPGGNGLVDFLPPSTGKTYHILITSRNSQWGASIIPCHLSILTTSESEQLIMDTLGTDRTLKSEDVKQLGERLQHFPLALQQAVAYILQTDEELRNVNKRYSIADYLQEFETKMSEVLSTNFPEDSNDKYAHAVSTTWEITFDKIKNERNGHLAVNILNVCAYLTPDNISSEMLMLDCDQRQLGSVLQDVVELKGKREGKEAGKIRAIFGWLDRCFPRGESVEDYVQKRKLLVHLETFLERVESYLQSVPMGASDPSINIIMESYNEYAGTFGFMLVQFGHALKAVQLLENELVRKKNLYGEDSCKLVNTMQCLARAYGRVGIYETENRILGEVAAIRKRELGPNQFEVTKVLAHLANSYGNLVYAEKKRKLLEQALVLTEALYGQDHWETGSIVEHLGNAYTYIGNYSIGKELLERALAINEQHYGADHIEFGKTLTNLGITCSELGEHKKGIELIERSLQIKEKHYGHDSFFVGRTLGYLGNVYRKSGDCMKAKDLQEEAVVKIERCYGSDHVQLCSLLMNLAMTYEALEDFEKREKVLQKATSIVDIRKLFPISLKRLSNSEA